MFFFFNDTATTEIYTLSLHDALPIFEEFGSYVKQEVAPVTDSNIVRKHHDFRGRMRAGLLSLRRRSEEHTSELQSRQYLVCRLLLEKKKNKNKIYHRSKHNDKRRRDK